MDDAFIGLILPAARNQPLYFQSIFANAGFTMAFGFQERKQFVVAYRRRQREVPAGVKEFPFKSIAVKCPLCGEQRQYLPLEIFLGRLNNLVAKHARAGVRGRV